MSSTLGASLGVGYTVLVVTGRSPIRAESRNYSAEMVAREETMSEGEESRGQGQQDVLARNRAKEQSGEAQQGAGIGGGAPQWFPLGAKEGFNQWWAGQSPAATEHRVLSLIPYLQSPPTHLHIGSAPVSHSNSSADLSAQPGPEVEHVTTNSINDPHGPRRWNSEMVELSGRGCAINEFSVERVGEDVENHLVMLHGYGAGLGFFYRNFEALSRAPGWKVIALDLLGMGRSSRPPYKVHAKDKEGKIKEAENWFIDALEEWRVKRGIEKFTLLGHSLGGYLAVAYALKYPGHLNKLILASPVGIPEDPYAVSEDMPSPDSSTMANEFTQDSAELRNGVPPTTSSPDNNNFLNQSKNRSADPTTNSTSRPPRRQLPKWLTYLWEANVVSPFSFVRWSGPLGPRLVSGWTSRRFSHLPAEEAQALHDYSYSLFRQRGSSEYALSHILAPGAFARSPLIRRIEGVGRQIIANSNASNSPNNVNLNSQSEPQLETGIPIVFMYGENDWMDVAGGFAAEEKILREKERILASKNEEEKKKDKADAKVVIIRKAGHHVYLDGWDQFNRVMLEEMGAKGKL